MDKTGTGQLVILMTVSRVFSEAALLPPERADALMQRFTVTVVSFLLLALLLLPLYFLSSGSGSAHMTRTVSPVSAVILALFCLMSIAETVLRLCSYITGTVFDASAAPVVLIFAAAAGLYALYCGLQASARAGAFAFAGLLLLLALIIIGVRDDIRPERIYPALAEKPETFFGETMRELSHGAEAAAFVLLYPAADSRKRLCLPLYLLASCAAILIIDFLYITVLGSFVGDLYFPFYTLSTVADINILNRINGIDVALWVAAAALRISLFAFAAKRALASFFPEERKRTVGAGVLLLAGVLIPALLIGSPDTVEQLCGLCSTAVPLIVCVCVIPTSELIRSLSAKRKEARA